MPAEGIKSKKKDGDHITMFKNNLTLLTPDMTYSNFKINNLSAMDNW